MEVPKYHETFIPILKVLEDCNTISTSELKKLVLERFYSDLPQELLRQKTQSGDILIMNRIAWGKTYLKQGGYIEQPQKALVAITQKGLDALKKGNLTITEVLRDKDFLAYRIESANRRDQQVEEVSTGSSPQDLIDQGIKAIDVQVKNELLTRLKNIDPYYFQRVIARLFEKMGYGDPLETPKSGDGGVDGVINQDELGLEKIYLQAKRYTENKVRETEIRNFIGAMSSDTNKGIFVTTSTFDEKAVQKAKDASQTIILVDGPRLVELMYKHGIGVQEKDTYKIKQIDEDFFEEE